MTAHKPLNQPESPPSRVRPALLIAMGLIVLILVALPLLFRSGNRPVEPAPELTTEEATAAPARTAVPPRPVAASSVPSTSAPPPGSAQARPVAPPPQTFLPISAEAQQQIAELLKFASEESLTAEQGALIQARFAELLAQGSDAAGAIEQFLQQNQDVKFGSAEKAGYESLRGGLLDVLRQTGGPEATGVLARTVQTTADPKEISLLARSLEELAPGEYHYEVVNAARQSLNLATRKQIEPAEVGPLFDVMRNFGDASVVRDLELAMPQWPYYGAMALATLPEGEGIPSLIRNVQQSTSAPNAFVLQLLAQASPHSPEAGHTLLRQSQEGRIPESAWARIAEGLAGDQHYFTDAMPDHHRDARHLPGLTTYHIKSGNQNFYSTRYIPPEEIAPRLQLIDQLIVTAPSPAAQQALQNARNLLQAQ